MNKKTILDNGILEQYLLGELNFEQQIEVERILRSDDELKEHFDNLEASFENIAIENQIQPPAIVKEKLMSSIYKDSNNVISIKNINTPKQYFKIASGFAVFLLLGSIWLFSQLNSVKNELKIVQEENTKLNKNIENLNVYLAETNKWYVAINNPDVQKYVLTGNASLPQATVISYINHKQRSVVINTKRLPKLDDNKDYQMWADVKGEMINMGVISKENDMLAMTYIENSESLNITIEPSGGNDHPTISNLITNVYLQ